MMSIETQVPNIEDNQTPSSTLPSIMSTENISIDKSHINSVFNNSKMVVAGSSKQRGSVFNAASALTSLVDGAADAVNKTSKDSDNLTGKSSQKEISEQTQDVKLSQDVPITFPQRLMTILSDDTNSEIIAWLPHGKGFIIYQKKRFAVEVLPRYFKQSKFTSFTRKLSRWGFTRVTRGAETGAYYHKFFQRGNTRLCMQMCCQSVKTSSRVSPSSGPLASPAVFPQDVMINAAIANMHNPGQFQFSGSSPQTSPSLLSINNANRNNNQLLYPHSQQLNASSPPIAQHADHSRSLNRLQQIQAADILQRRAMVGLPPILPPTNISNLAPNSLGGNSSASLSQQTHNPQALLSSGTMVQSLLNNESAYMKILSEKTAAVKAQTSMMLEEILRRRQALSLAGSVADISSSQEQHQQSYKKLSGIINSGSETDAKIYHHQQCLQDSVPTQEESSHHGSRRASAA